jgi:2-polyprenyl-6-methoxyphenol hydroxylase-like FAD-dependent oxidoreductase
MASNVGEQAIVIGGGMGGLAAAGALANHFEKVVVLERDFLPPNVSERPGTPQCRHIHALLAGGQRALHELFPAFEHDLARAGAVPLRVATDLRLEVPGYDPFPQRDLGWHVYSMSRPLIELVVRQQVQRYANVTQRERCRVRNLIVSPDREMVAGVRCENGDGRSETLPADLVVDASGRGSLTQDLLASIGQPLPEKTVIGVDFGYARAIFAIPDDASADWKGAMTLPNASEDSRGALMLPIEGQRWMVGFAGRYGEKPPGDFEGFLAFAQQMRTSTVYNAIRRAQPLGNVARYGFAASVWRHFEKLETFPRGLLPFGDAICRFNPVWGQGMSVAAQEAVLLRRVLGSDDGIPLRTLARSFFAEASELIETPWVSAAIPDFAFPQTEGERPADLDRMLKFGNALTRLAADDPAVHKLTVEVRHLLKPRSALRDPDLVGRVEDIMAEM